MVGTQGRGAGARPLAVVLSSKMRNKRGVNPQGGNCGSMEPPLQTENSYIDAILHHLILVLLRLLFQGS